MEFVPFLALALLGAVHCAGMCGPFVALLGTAPTKSALVRRQMVFLSGKALTYSVLATATARLAEGALSEPGRLQALRSGLAWASGVFLIVHGCTCMGLTAKLLPGFGSGRATAGFRAAFGHLRSLPGYGAPLGAGLAAGLLPCGLSWSAILLAASLPPASAGFAMLLFGLGTGPALITVGLSWRWLSLSRRRLAGAALGPLLILFGLWTVARGGLPLGTERHVLPDCCAEDAAH